MAAGHPKRPRVVAYMEADVSQRRRVLERLRRQGSIIALAVAEEKLALAEAALRVVARAKDDLRGQA